MKIVKKNLAKYQLRQGNVRVLLPSDCVEDDTKEYILYRAVTIYKDKLVEYSNECFEIPKGTDRDRLGQKLTTTLAGFRYVGAIDKAPLAKKVVISSKVSFNDFKANHLQIEAKCLVCNKNEIIRGNTRFQKKLSRVPGSKNMYYTCSDKCKRDYKEQMQLLNGETTKEVRKRYHKAMYSNVYGYVYGIYNKVEKKWYVGKVARSPFARWEEHMMKNKILANMNIADMRFEILYTQIASGDGDKDIGELWNQELYYITKYDSIENGYNIQQPNKYIRRDEHEEQFISNEELYKIMIGGKDE